MLPKQQKVALAVLTGLTLVGLASAGSCYVDDATNEKVWYWPVSQAVGFFNAQTVHLYPLTVDVPNLKDAHSLILHAADDAPGYVSVSTMGEVCAAATSAFSFISQHATEVAQSGLENACLFVSTSSQFYAYCPPLNETLASVVEQGIAFFASGATEGMCQSGNFEVVPNSF